MILSLSVLLPRLGPQKISTSLGFTLDWRQKFFGNFLFRTHKPPFFVCVFRIFRSRTATLEVGLIDRFQFGSSYVSFPDFISS